MFLILWLYPGFLLSLLTQLTNISTPSLRRDVETQTGSLSSHGESLGMMTCKLKWTIFGFICDIQHGFPKSVPFFLSFTVEKMKMIDKEYQGLSSSEDKVFYYQSKLAAYRKEAGAQMEAEMNTKVHAVKHPILFNNQVFVCLHIDVCFFLLFFPSCNILKKLKSPRWGWKKKQSFIRSLIRWSRTWRGLMKGRRRLWWSGRKMLLIGCKNSKR